MTCLCVCVCVPSRVKVRTRTQRNSSWFFAVLMSLWFTAHTRAVFGFANNKHRNKTIQIAHTHIRLEAHMYTVKIQLFEIVAILIRILRNCTHIQSFIILCYILSGAVCTRCKCKRIKSTRGDDWNWIDKNMLNELQLKSKFP